MTRVKQRIVVTTLEEGDPVETEYVADAYRVEDTEYVLTYQGEEVARIPVETVMPGTDETGGIRTIYSRS